MNKVSAELLMGLEQDTQNLSKLNLKFVFTLVFFLQNSDILFIKFIFFLTIHVLFLIFVVVLNSVFRLLQELKYLC